CVRRSSSRRTVPRTARRRTARSSRVAVSPRTPHAFAPRLEPRGEQRQRRFGRQAVEHARAGARQTLEILLALLAEFERRCAHARPDRQLAVGGRAQAWIIEPGE